MLDGLTDTGLDRSVTSATQFLTDATGLTVADCLRVVLNEEWQHRLYAERDGFTDRRRLRCVRRSAERQ